MPPGRKKGTGKYPGLKVGGEDINWLERAASHGGRDIPGFNLSRLIALRLVELTASGLIVTERGRALLANTTR